MYLFKPKGTETLSKGNVWLKYHGKQNMLKKIML